MSTTPSRRRSRLVSRLLQATTPTGPATPMYTDMLNGDAPRALFVCPFGVFEEAMFELRALYERVRLLGCIRHKRASVTLTATLCCPPQICSPASLTPSREPPLVLERTISPELLHCFRDVPMMMLPSVLMKGASLRRSSATTPTATAAATPRTPGASVRFAATGYVRGGRMGHSWWK